MPLIRPAAAADFPAIWAIFQPVVAGADSYVYPPNTTRAQARRIWMDPPAVPHVAEVDGNVVGTYTLRPNQRGLGDHVANCSYMTHPGARGRGIADAMCEHSLNAARERGYRAMQFNFVVATNEAAIHLWQKHGFAIVGRVPNVFRHAQFGDTDVLVMHRVL